MLITYFLIRRMWLTCIRNYCIKKKNSIDPVHKRVEARRNLGGSFRLKTGVKKRLFAPFLRSIVELLHAYGRTHHTHGWLAGIRCRFWLYRSIGPGKKARVDDLPAASASNGRTTLRATTRVLAHVVPCGVDWADTAIVLFFLPSKATRNTSS